MKHSQAVKVAIDANLHKKLTVGNPSAVRAAKEYDRIEKAIAVLSQQPLEI